MSRKIVIGNSKRIVTLQPSNYKAAGGQAEIFVNGGMAYKLYHDPVKTMLPIAKMNELRAITNPQVVLPQEVIYDTKTGDPVGYTTRFIDNAEPMLRLFTRTFKTDHNIDQAAINELVKRMQLITTDIHAAQCLIVDYNELNVLISVGNTLTPYYIDVDSYATPSFKATAIMDSIRDRKATTYSGGHMEYHPTMLTDWFSWAIITFWTYTNIHPFRGMHPSYRPADKQKQMDDGISVFHKGIRVPPSVNDFSLIPKRHLDWYKAIFLNGDRSVPPLPDSTAPVLVPTQIITVKGTDKLSVTQIDSFTDDITGTFQFLGMNYVVTKEHVFTGQQDLSTHKKSDEVTLAVATDGTVVKATKRGNTVYFTELRTGEALGTIATPGMFTRNGCVYTITNNRMVENAFIPIGNKVGHRINEIENVSTTSATIYSGCIIQDLLGKKYLTIPYAKGSGFSKYIAALDGFRVVDAKSEKTVTVILAEKAGKYHRFIIVFDKRFQNFDVREVKDVTYEEINIAVLDNGLCCLLASQNELELFATAGQYETLADPPFDADMPLFATDAGFFFINGNSIHQIKRK